MKEQERERQNHGTLYQHMDTKIHNETQHEKSDSINLCNLSRVMAVHCFDIHCNPHLQDKRSEIRPNDDAALCTGLCNGSMGGCAEHGKVPHG